MRLSLILLCIFLTIVLLGSTSHQSTEEGIVFVYTHSLPSFGIFIVIVLILLMLLCAFFLYVQLKELKGAIVLRRSNLDIRNALKVIFVFFCILLLGSGFISVIAFRDFAVVLFACLLFYLICKLVVSIVKPVSIAVSDDILVYRTLLKFSKRRREDLVNIVYLVGKKSLSFQFKDGLDSFELSLSDYSTDDLRNLVFILEPKVSVKLNWEALREGAEGY